MSDVDLQNAVLTVRGTKFGKCRLVPLHSSTRRVLSRYKSRRDQYLKGQPISDCFFVTKRGTRLDKDNVRGTVHALSRQIGLRGEFDSHGPRLHDFRHRFAL
jgi:integrase/recombinase XerD